MTAALSLGVVILIDSQVGLHNVFGWMGDIELLVTNIVIGGLLCFYLTRFILTVRPITKSLLIEHLSQTGTLYVILLILIYNLCSSHMHHGLYETYLSVLAISLFTVLSANAITIFGSRQATP